jgi:glucose-6-phosphate dehydrogenase assembly protein OpcA
MSTQTAPLVSLQAPKDISIDDIEAELSKIWQVYGNNEDGLAATRATTFTFIIYEPEPTQQLLAALGYYTGPVDGIAGPRTKAAIKSAQKAFGLTVTGKSSDRLLSELQGVYSQALASGTLTNAAQRAAQTYSPDLEGSGIADAIASTNPCRIVTLCPTVGEDEGVQAQVSAYCPVQKRNNHALVCCEYITLRGTASALERVGGIISALAIAGLPKFVWWKASPIPEYNLFQRLSTLADTVIVDSSTFRLPETDLLQTGQLATAAIPVADLNWARLAPWQELTAEAFDAPERRASIGEIDEVAIDYEQGNATQALMYLGWFASRLQWKPVGYRYEGGDYDLRHFQFVTAEQRTISAELAGIPIADWGEVQGDLISLKLSSTNPAADCCTVICSGTVGCMRMEVGGGAQSCRIQQITPLDDQKTENLLGQQLLRWGADKLYEESMSLTLQILNLIDIGIEDQTN